MAIFGRYYHLQFKHADRNHFNTVVENTVHVRIYDLSLEGDDTIAWDIVELEPSGDPFHTSTIDNSEDKFTGIKPTQATIKFISSHDVNVSTFADSNIDTSVGGVDVGDPRWYVEAYLNDYDPKNFIFKGFLNLEDCSEAFLPIKNEVVLIANDGLAGLKNIPLVKTDGSTPTGENRIGDYLTWALKKTGLELNLNAVFNIRESSLGNDHFFDKIYLHAKTFEDQIGTSINCFDVIERILGEEAFLCQRGGQWWIIRVDELGNNHGYYRAIFNSDGVLQSIENEVFFVRTIEKDTTGVFFSQESTNVFLLRPNKSIQETYGFDFPKEIVDNIDLSRGLVPIGSPILTPDGYEQKYTVEDWTVGRYPTNNENSIASAGITPYVVKVFQDANLTYEKTRYVVVPWTDKGWFTDSLPSVCIRSNPIYVGVRDRMTVSVDFKFNKISVGNRPGVFGLLLKGNSGKHYIFGGDPGFWLDTAIYGTSPSPTLYGVIITKEYIYTSGTDKVKWQTMSAEVSDIPEDGELYILLLAGYNWGGTGDPDVHYSNIRFDYSPYINGSYSKYSSQYYKVFRNENFINKREKQVYLRDAPKKLFKGALLKLDAWVTFLTSQSVITTTIFGTNLRIVTAVATGDVRGLFSVGGKIKISGTASNNGIYTVASLNYTSGNTVIETVEPLTAEGGFPTITFQSATYKLTNEFYSWVDVHTSSPDPTYVHPYGHIQAFDVWNQHRNVNRKFQATAQGLSFGSYDQSAMFLAYPSLIHRFYLQDSSENTDNKYFMLLSFDIDWFLCEWKGTLVECYDTIEGKHYNDNLETKYLQ